MSHRFMLHTFGGLALSACDSGEPVLVNQRKRLAFIAALAADANGGMAREFLFALFWPESDGERARNALNQMVFAVRRDLGDDAIVGDSVVIRLSRAVVESDLRLFREALAAKRLPDAINLYRGVFLDGVFLRDTAEFERWVDGVRRALADEYAAALESEVDAALNAGVARSADAVRYARILSAHDPLSTRGALRLMRALENSGDTAAALRHAAVHATLVRAELASEPGPELEREVARLRANGSAGGTPEARFPISHGPAVNSKYLDPTGADSANASRDLPAVSPSSPTRFWVRRRTLGVGLMVAAAAAVVAVVARITSRPTLDARRVVIASFDNRTGDSTLDDLGRVAADVITEQVARAGFVNVVDPATALASSRHVRSVGTLEDRGAALQLLANTTHARLVVTGSYFRDGDSLVAQARMTDATTNDVLAATEPVRAPLGQPELLIQPLRQRVMGALALRVDKRLSTLVESGRTPTYEAYRSFVAGLDVFTSGRFRAAAPYFHRAYTLDTTFIEPLIWEAMAVQTSPKLRVIVGILEQRRAELSELNRYALDYNRALLSDNLETALPAAQSAARLAPGSFWMLNVATLLFRFGRIREAVDVWSTIQREGGWLTRFPAVWYGYVWALHDAGLHRQELDRVREARAMFPEAIDLQQAEAIALAVNGKWDELNRRLDSLERQAPLAVATVASELRVHGDRDHADAMTRRCLRLSNSPPPIGVSVADFRGERAQLLYDCGQWSAAARLLDSLQSDPQQPPPQHALWVRALAISNARLGDRTRAAAVLDSLAKDSSAFGNGVRFYDAARLAALLGDRARAVALLQPLRTYPGYWLHYNANAADFASLVGYAPFERLRAGH
jgi:DNA-binding SARP family transcriptional activator/tetratricopeptide (TPR) repeat protein